MKKVLVSQRIEKHHEYREYRDCIDQNWISLLELCNILPILVPNNSVITKYIVKEIDYDGVILTGGNDLSIFDDTYKQRDETELILFTMAREKEIPILGVCRGMQFIQNQFDVPLKSVSGHVQESQEVTINGKVEIVNSYHNYGTNDTVESLDIWACSSDGVVKAVKHIDEPIIGIMWHPERINPFRPEDINLITSHFDIKN